ncbi:MAG: 1-phosphofructokinase, partial [Firmicutes bacterium]|nr:1-phosphofructokinase [Bacillota bacterium]
MNRVRSKIDHPSGKGINASLTLSSLGQSTEALAFIGGESGRWLVKALLDQGLTVDCVEVEGDTRINLKVWSEKERQSTEINEPGPLVTEKELAELKSKVFTKA